MKSLLILVLAFGVSKNTFAFISNTPVLHSEPIELSEILAYNYAIMFVKEQLKSPASAKFPDSRLKKSHTTALGGGKYRINSWVDSQNSFGAMIRTKFSCTIIIDGTNVQCQGLTFDE